MAAKHELNFLEFLQGFRRGDLLAEADAQMNELMQAVMETGAGGEITLRLPFKVNKAGQIECTPEIKSKRPRRPLGAGIFYLTDEGRLSRRDPAQDDMFDDFADRRAAEQNH